MWKESPEARQGNSPPALRTGLTTGCCATACCVAAALYLLAQQAPAVISATLPVAKATRSRKNKTVELAIKDYQTLATGVRTSTIKDAGDDPDATHGATVFVELQLRTDPGIEFRAAAGVGTVTREGLSLAVGEPAINPVPRQMITQHLQQIARDQGYQGGFSVAIGIENGAAIAQKTMNPRLGIVGGLSILGTTGIVRPFSCAAWVASIYRGIDVAEANGCNHIAASTGNRSQQTVKNLYGLEDMALIEMGDFAGAVVKYVKKLALKKLSVNKKPAIKKLSICGGCGKISKLSQGHMDLNSRASVIDFDYLASVAGDLGASQSLRQKIQQSNTSIEALQHCQQQQIALAAALCDRALDVAQKILPDFIEAEIMAIDRRGNLVASTGLRHLHAHT